MLSREIFENLHTVVAISVLFDSGDSGTRAEPELQNDQRRLRHSG